MAAQPAQARCNDFCCSAFLNYDDEVPTSYPPTDKLTNEIHPIFAFENWTDLEPEPFDRTMNQGLRFLSRCLKADRCVKWIYTMMEGDLYVVDKSTNVRTKISSADFDDDDRHDRYPKPGQEVVDDAQRKAVADFLSKAAGMIKFSLEDMPASKHAYTKGSDEPPLPAHLATAYPLGERSEIYLNEKDVESLAEPREDATAPSIREQMGAELVVFCTILHEMGHAFHNLIQGSRGEETYYMDSPFSECGYEFASQVLGGLIEIERPEIPECPHIELVDWEDWFRLTIAEWPNFVSANHYTRGGAKFGSRLPSLSTCAVLARISYTRVAKVMTDTFWNEEAPALGDRPLFCMTDGPRWLSKWSPSGVEFCHPAENEFTARERAIMAEIQASTTST